MKQNVGSPVILVCRPRQRWKNFQNRLTVDEVTAKSLTPRFLRHSVHSVFASDGSFYDISCQRCFIATVAVFGLAVFWELSNRRHQKATV